MYKITPSPHPDSTCRPPNHNPLIASERWETLSNVHDAIATLQEMTIMPLGGELVLSEAATSGMYMLLACTREALHYEITEMEHE